MKALDLILKFIEKHAPWVFLGYWLGTRKTKALKRENTKLRLERDVAHDEKEIREHNAGLTNDQLKSEILGRSRGRK